MTQKDKKEIASGSTETLEKVAEILAGAQGALMRLAPGDYNPADNKAVMAAWREIGKTRRAYDEALDDEKRKRDDATRLTDEEKIARAVSALTGDQLKRLRTNVRDLDEDVYPIGKNGRGEAAKLFWSDLDRVLTRYRVATFDELKKRGLTTDR